MNTKNFLKRKTKNKEHPIYAGMGQWCILCNEHSTLPGESNFFGDGDWFESKFNNNTEICDLCIMDLNIKDSYYN